MPDTWTGNPQHLRDIMIALDAKCGVEPRVLTPRDPNWTCHIDTDYWSGDIYIHHFSELYKAPITVSLIVLMISCSILIGLVWGRWFWRRSTS